MKVVATRFVNCDHPCRRRADGTQDTMPRDRAHHIGYVVSGTERIDLTAMPSVTVGEACHSGGGGAASAAVPVARRHVVDAGRSLPGAGRGRHADLHHVDDEIGAIQRGAAIGVRGDRGGGAKL
jgi:hypothetical protein